jgi:hypothetical protein
MWLRLPQGNAVVLAVLRSPVHRLLSGLALELRYTGRRSGREYVLPVQYVRAGGRIVIRPQAAQRTSWWRNFQTPAPGGGPARRPDVSRHRPRGEPGRSGMGTSAVAVRVTVAAPGRSADRATGGDLSGGLTLGRAGGAVVGQRERAWPYPMRTAARRLERSRTALLTPNGQSRERCYSPLVRPPCPPLPGHPDQP